MSEYLQFYFAVDEDEIEQHDSVLTKRADLFTRIEFVRKCYASYLKMEKNVGKAFDDEGYSYNYSLEKDRVFRSKEPDPAVLKYLKEMDEDNNDSFFGY